MPLISHSSHLYALIALWIHLSLFCSTLLLTPSFPFLVMTTTKEKEGKTTAATRNSEDCPGGEGEMVFEHEEQGRKAKRQRRGRNNGGGHR
ncbi:unnamed protein product [Linum trigynum]|uniref:Secreted protein n=1 Tax=Linum trigynum TaxID=586398 RepID=A0AAV2FTU6_9ROSI